MSLFLTDDELASALQIVFGRKYRNLIHESRQDIKPLAERHLPVAHLREISDTVLNMLYSLMSMQKELLESLEELNRRVSNIEKALKLDQRRLGLLLSVLENEDEQEPTDKELREMSDGADTT